MRNTTLLFLILFVFSSCKKKDYDIVNLNGNKISILGHGGMGIGQTYPLNSFESILNCLSLGADGTEIDVQMTKDSVLVAYHPSTLEKATTHSGQIYKQNYAEIEGATYTDQPYTSYRVITLDELFSNINNPTDYTFFLDCKNYNQDNSTAYVNTYNNALVKLIDKHNLKDNINIEFKREDLIESLISKRPDLNVFIYSDFETGFQIADKFNLQGIISAIDEITSEDVEKAHYNGYMVAVFNAHSKSRNIDGIEKNVDYIQTDRVKHLIRLLK